MKRLLPVFGAFFAFSLAAACGGSPAPKHTLAKEFVLSYNVPTPAAYSKMALNRQALNNQDFHTGEETCIPVTEVQTGCALRVTPFILGPAVYPGPEWTFYDDEGSIITTFRAPDTDLDIAKPFRFAINRNLKEIRGHYFAWDRWLFIIIVTIFLFGLLGWLYLRRLKTRVPAPPSAQPEPNIPPEILSKEQIAALLKSGVWDRGEYKNFYISLTDIFRRYLHKRFSLNAEFQTSAQTLNAIKKSRAKTILTPARALLESADLIKFAELTPAEPRRDADVKTLISIIDATTPPPPTPEEK